MVTCENRTGLLSLKERSLRELHSLKICKSFVQRKAVPLFIQSEQSLTENATGEC